MGLGSCMRSLGWRHDRPRRATLAGKKTPDEGGAAPQQPIPPVRILNDFDLRERGTKLRRMRDLAAQTTADAVIVDMGHGIGAQRVLIGCERERWTAGKPDARVVPGAQLGVDPKACAHHALTGVEKPGQARPDAALTRQLTFTICDDDLETLLSRAHGLAQRVHDRTDTIGPVSPDPGDP